MPRINIEDKWWSDLRRSRLLALLGGDEERTDGAMLRAAKLAQQYWLPGKELIPLKAWDACKMLPELFECGLAERRENGVYVCGSEEYFKWWFLRQEAGRQGGLARASNAKQALSKFKQNVANLPSSSSSSSSSNTKAVNENQNAPSTDVDRQPPKLIQIWNEEAKHLPQAMACNAARAKRALARWRENPSEDYWRGVIREMDANPFLTGKNDRGWRAGIDWLLQPESHLKVSEGFYRNTQAEKKVKWIP